MISTVLLPAFVCHRRNSLGESATRALGCATSTRDGITDWSPLDCVSQLQGKLLMTPLSHDNHCIRSQGNIWQQILSFHFILELVTTVPFLFTVSHSSRSFSPNLILHPLICVSTDLLSIPEASLHSRVPQLLACQALAREHVCKSLKSFG